MALLLALLIGVGAPPPVQAMEEPLVMGVFPRRNAKATYRMFSPLASYLETMLKRPVRLETGKDFPTFWKKVEERALDLVHFNQLHYIRAHDKFGYDAILMNEEFGESTLSGSLVVRANSGIRTLDDLRGKTILFGGGRSAMMSFVAPRYLLMQAGLKESDYISKYALNPPNAALSVAHHQAEAAGIGQVVLRLPTVTSRIEPGQLTTLAVGDPLPHLPWAVKSDMPSELQRRIQKLMVDLAGTAAGRKVLASAGLTALLAAEDGDFDPHRKMINAVFDAQ
ncbi:putative phosphonate ABC transporter periplasmic phosphonate-binding protein [Magnetofaba australis IT-1]|uniref:Putative phosphonate ABC transporter periplasmic phosphonate-binding protein n=2 Tax=Magnetofaba TaxID=1472292 RepID=A0A1Y2K8X9_9PROT|nr:putative phosphonate ABC transporter periplasmic phosphonate-binding protein [Magnetofaba australis IT-1]